MLEDLSRALIERVGLRSEALSVMDEKNPDRATVYLGKNEWPFPVPLVRTGAQWRFDGKAGLEEFTTAYGKLLDAFQQRTRRIVLVSPTPFAKSAAGCSIL